MVNLNRIKVLSVERRTVGKRLETNISKMPCTVSSRCSNSIQSDLNVIDNNSTINVVGRTLIEPSVI